MNSHWEQAPGENKGLASGTQGSEGLSDQGGTHYCHLGTKDESILQEKIGTRKHKAVLLMPLGLRLLPDILQSSEDKRHFLP